MGASMNLQVGIKGLKRGSNILDLQVPAELKRKRKTGLDFFDDGLGGEGFTPSTSMMLTGGPGCGKTTMMLQLADAITGSGHIALMNTGEESLYQVRMVTERLKLKHGFVPGQDTKVADLLAHAKMLQDKEVEREKDASKRKQVFIIQDSLQTLDDGFYGNGATNSCTPLRCCELLTDWAKSTYGILVFIGQVTKSGEFAGKNAIKHAVDVHGRLYFDDDKKSETYGRRLFEFTKNRFGCNGKTYILGMEKTGLREEGSFSKAG